MSEGYEDFKNNLFKSEQVIDVTYWLDEFDEALERYKQSSNILKQQYDKYHMRTISDKQRKLFSEVIEKSERLLEELLDVKDILLHQCYFLDEEAVSTICDRVRIIYEEFHEMKQAFIAKNPEVA